MKRTPLRRKSQLKRKPAFQTSSRKSKRSTPMKRCDDLARAIVLARGRCEGRCGVLGRTPETPLQWAHIQPRSYHGPRHDEDNALCLCLSCHVYFTHRPLEFIRHVGEERWWDLYHRALAGLGEKIDWKEREARLRERAHHMGVA